MLHRPRRSRLIRLNYYHHPMPRAQRIVIFVVVSVLLLLTAVSIILIQLRPLVFQLAKTMVTDVMLIEVNDVIEEEVLKGSFDYNKLVTFEKDNEGNISALVTNTAMINTLQTRISNGVFRKVDDQLYSDLDIPIGDAIGGVLFSGRGPNFRVKILSIADVNTGFSNSFTEAGINQTRHRIYLDISIEVDIFIPGYSSEAVVVTNQVAIAETVIVGKVPNVYADLGEE